MRMLNVVIGAVLLVFAGLHLFIPNHLLHALLFCAGAGLAFVTVFSPRNLSVAIARILAICTTAAMFIYFAGFFSMAAGFEEQWYRTGAAVEGIGFLLAAFMMIPTLSWYSCLLKAEGCEHFREQQGSEETERGGFFGVPDKLRHNP